MSKNVLVILCEKFVSAEIDFTLSQKTVMVHEIMVKLITLSIEI